MVKFATNVVEERRNSLQNQQEKEDKQQLDMEELVKYRW